MLLVLIFGLTTRGVPNVALAPAVFEFQRSLRDLRILLPGPPRRFSVRLPWPTPDRVPPALFLKYFRVDAVQFHALYAALRRDGLGETIEIRPPRRSDGRGAERVPSEAALMVLLFWLGGTDDGGFF